MNFYKLPLLLLLIFLFSTSTLTAAETTTKTATDTITTEKVTAVKKALPIDMMCEEIAGVENLPGGFIGADVCVACHEDKLQTMLHTSHGQSSDPRAPFGQRDCETCHGAGMEHIESEDRQCVVSLKGTYGEVIAERNDVCLSCHKGDDLTHWFSSRHEAEDMACVNCHTIHEPNAVIERSTQAEVCYGCHKDIRAQTFRASSHPIREGKVICSDCHEPHSSIEQSSLKQFSINQNCYSCHAEKRGPFLWEHYPVSEDCTLCHRAHGSNHQALLKKSGPQLCQQCHADKSGIRGRTHISRFQDYSSNDLKRARFSVGLNCANCHSKVHGSNHPSGAALQR